VTGPGSADARSCAVCARVLDLFLDDQTGERTWIHGPADRPEDHPAVPVPTEAVTTLGRCDFCSVDDPQWIAPARSFRPDINPTTGWLSGAGSAQAWAACDTRAGLVRTNQWAVLRRHALAVYRRAEAMRGQADEQLGAQFNQLWRQLRPHITGPPIHKETPG
jgi:hypothetical protein